MPKYLLLENVSNLVSKKFIKDFENLNVFFDELGFNVYYKILNAKECGIPQNRCRVFGIYVRKDIDTGNFTFPEPFDNGLRLKDILEHNVEEKYYINTERASNLIRQLVDKGQLKGQRECADSTIMNPNTREISNCITARYDASIQNKPQIGLVVCEPNAEQKRLGGLWDNETGKHQAGSVWDTNGMSPTLDTAQGGGRMPHILENNPQVVIGSTQKNAYIGDGSISSTLTSAMGEGGGHVPMLVFEDTTKPIYLGNTTPSGKSQCNAVYSTEGVSQTLCAGTHGYATGNILEESTTLGDIICEAEKEEKSIEKLYSIRKLTPNECWLLMGLEKEDCIKAANLGISNSSLYKIAGNGIVTNCIKLIAEHLYKAQYDPTYICSDENFQNPKVK